MSKTTESGQPSVSSPSRSSDDWKDLHSWAFAFCKTHDITRVQFLADVCGLPTTPTYQQYLSYDGVSRRVSDKEGTKGHELRKALRREMINYADGHAFVPVTPKKAVDVVDDYYCNNARKFYEMGITCIYCDEDSKGKVSLLITTKQDSKLTTQDVLEALPKDTVDADYITMMKMMSLGVVSSPMGNSKSRPSAVSSTLRDDSGTKFPKPTVKCVLVKTNNDQ